ALEALVVGDDLRADPEGALVARRLDRLDDVVVVDGEADPHVVHRCAGWPEAATVALIGVGLLVDEMTLDVPEPVGAPIAATFDAADVEVLAGHGRRERHGRGDSRNAPGAAPGFSRSRTSVFATASCDERILEKGRQRLGGDVARDEGPA